MAVLAFVPDAVYQRCIQALTLIRSDVPFHWSDRNISGGYHKGKNRKTQLLTIRSTNPQDPKAVGEMQVVAQASSCQAQYCISCFCLLHFQPKLPICGKQIRIKLLQRSGLCSSADKPICTQPYNRGIKMCQWVRSALFSLKTGKHGIHSHHIKSYYHGMV